MRGETSLEMRGLIRRLHKPHVSHQKTMCPSDVRCILWNRYGNGFAKVQTYEAALCQLAENPLDIRQFNSNIQEERWTHFSATATVAGHFPAVTASSVKPKPKKANAVEESPKEETQANATTPKPKAKGPPKLKLNRLKPRKEAKVEARENVESRSQDQIRGSSNAFHSCGTTSPGHGVRRCRGTWTVGLVSQSNDSMRR